MAHAAGGPEGARPASKPRISVIVAITHREVLSKAVAALARQTLAGSEFEVIIADGLLSDDWGARLPEVPGKRKAGCRRGATAPPSYARGRRTS